MAKERLKGKKKPSAKRGPKPEIRGRLARIDEAVSSEEEAEGRLAQLTFDDWLERR